MFVIVVTAILMFLSACSSKQPIGPDAARALIEESADSIGGWQAMDSIKAQEIVTGGGDWEPHQAPEPGAPGPQVNNFAQTVLVDFEKGRLKLTFDAKRTYPAPGPVKFAEVIEGDIGVLQTTDAQGKPVSQRLHPSRLATRQRDLRRMPLRVLYIAKNASDLSRDVDRAGDKGPIHILRYTDSGAPVELHIDSFDKLPVRVIYSEDDPIFGDTLNEVAFLDWRETSAGVRLPYTIAVFLNGNKIREERVRTLINNPDLDDAAFAIPDDVRAMPDSGEKIVSQWPLRRIAFGVGYEAFGTEQKVDLSPIAPGVFHVTGGSHHSMVVEMSDHLIVVEMPLFEERSLAVIKALEEKFPGKPIRYGVVTHFHNDHSGGVRAYAAKGATIVGHESIVPFLKDVMARPKTIRPDSLAKAGNITPNVEGVADVKTLTDGSRTVELRTLSNPHVAGMLVAYLPQEKIVFVSDIYSPGGTVQPGDPNALALYSALRNANILVDKIVGGHGGIGPFKDLAKVDVPAVRLP